MMILLMGKRQQSFSNLHAGRRLRFASCRPTLDLPLTGSNIFLEVDCLIGVRKSDLAYRHVTAAIYLHVVCLRHYWNPLANRGTKEGWEMALKLAEWQWQHW